jgi:hypothetical protein
MYIGVAASTSSEASWSKGKQDGSTTNMGARNDNVYSAYRLTSLGGNLRRIGLLSFDADGWTDTYPDAGSGTIKGHVLMLGGASITNFGILEIATPTTGTPPFTQDYTVGFQPDGMIVCGTYTGAAAPTASTNLSRLTVGLSDMTNNWSVYSGQGTVPFSRFHRCSDTHCILAGDSDGDLTDSGKWLANHANGPTITWTARNSTARYITLICFKGPIVTVGIDTTPNGGTPPVTKNLSIGEVPKALILVGSGLAAVDSTCKNCSSIAFGAASATDERAVVWSGHNVSTAADYGLEQDNLYLTYDAGTPTLKERADITTLDETSVLTFDTVDTDEDYFGWMSLSERADGAAMTQII